jgi:hypothetical protein
MPQGSYTSPSAVASQRLSRPRPLLVAAWRHVPTSVALEPVAPTAGAWRFGQMHRSAAGAMWRPFRPAWSVLPHLPQVLQHVVQLAQANRNPRHHEVANCRRRLGRCFAGKRNHVSSAGLNSASVPARSNVSAITMRLNLARVVARSTIARTAGSSCPCSGRSSWNPASRSPMTSPCGTFLEPALTLSETSQLKGRVCAIEHELFGSNSRPVRVPFMVSVGAPSTCVHPVGRRGSEARPSSADITQFSERTR